jgi:hypothetical protein
LELPTIVTIVGWSEGLYHTYSTQASRKVEAVLVVKVLPQWEKFPRAFEVIGYDDWRLRLHLITAEFLKFRKESKLLDKIMIQDLIHDIQDCEALERGKVQDKELACHAEFNWVKRKVGQGGQAREVDVCKISDAEIFELYAFDWKVRLAEWLEKVFRNDLSVWRIVDFTHILTPAYLGPIYCKYREEGRGANHCIQKGGPKLKSHMAPHVIVSLMFPF